MELGCDDEDEDTKNECHDIREPNAMALQGTNVSAMFAVTASATSAMASYMAEYFKCHDIRAT